LKLVKVLVNNQLIEYKDEGSGRVLLLLHGWGTDMGTFDQMAEHLKKKFRVVRFDFPGFGQSPKPSDDWAVANYATLTRDLLDKLDIKQIYSIIAHSFGGRVIIKGLSIDALKPQKVVLIGAAGVKPHQNIKSLIYKIVAKIGKFLTSMPIINKLQPSLRKRLYGVVGSTDYLQAKQMKNIFQNVINEDLLPEIPDITIPTLLIWGENDSETPVNDAKLMLHSLKNGQLVIVPNAGHFVYTEAFDVVAKAMDDFLS